MRKSRRVRFNTDDLVTLEYTVLRIFGLWSLFAIWASAAIAQPTRSSSSTERAVQLTGVAGAQTAIALRVRMQPEHAGQADRVVDAAQEALDLYGRWMFPFRGDHLEIVDLPWNAIVGVPETDVVTVRTRWLEPQLALRTEARVAQGLAWQWWGVAIKVRAEDVALMKLMSGLNRYLSGRVLERIFDRRFRSPAHSAYTRRFFGGFIPWTLRDVRFTRESAERRSWIAGDEDAAAARTALAFATLERYLGWPAFQAALSETARRFTGAEMSRADFFQAMNEATGRDLTWFFDQAFNKPDVFDYSVDSLSSETGSAAECGAQPCYKTDVTVGRKGSGIFSGTGLAPVGAYESGNALAIGVTFSDGQRITDSWDGRAQTKTLTYYSAVRARAATIDPGRTLLLDANFLNNSRTLEAVSPVAYSRWAMKWMVWLEDQLLTDAFFV